MKDLTERITELVRDAGGQEPIKVGVLHKVGWVYVRYTDDKGMRETRWGTSHQDLLERVESWRKKH